MKSKLAIALISSVLGASSYAGSIALNDDAFSFKLNGANVAGGLYEARWGSYSSGVFSPFFGNVANEANGAYIDTATPELIVAATAGDNVSVPSTGLYYIWISLLADDSSYALATPTNSVILTDPSWVAASFNLLGPDLQYSFTTNTTVALLTGQNASTSFSFNGGNEIINLVTTAVPEPSSYAAIAGLGILGFAASRRRRVA